MGQRDSARRPRAVLSERVFYWARGPNAALASREFGRNRQYTTQSGDTNDSMRDGDFRRVRLEPAGEVPAPTKRPCSNLRADDAARAPIPVSGGQGVWLMPRAPCVSCAVAAGMPSALAEPGFRPDLAGARRRCCALCL